MSPIEVVPYDPTWPSTFLTLRDALTTALFGVPIISIEHVGSTSVPGLTAKPIIDIDIIVSRPSVPLTFAALKAAGYTHKGNLGLEDRDAFAPPAGRANIYVCVEGTIHLRNHLAVRDALRRDDALRDEYAAVKMRLAAVPGMDIGKYLAGKSDVLLKILEGSDLSQEEKRIIRRINDPDA